MGGVEETDPGDGGESPLSRGSASDDSGHKLVDPQQDAWHPDPAEFTGNYVSANNTQPFTVNGSAISQKSTEADSAALLGDIADSIAALRKEFPHIAAPAHGPARWVRVLTGVDEKLLDRVWEERARYTGLGTIVLGTAAMAVLSMLDALDQVFGPVWPILLLVALFWGAFICAIDRWLISSTHGVRGSRARVFLPRILLALLFGVIIATPLVLTVFGSEVVSRAHNDQNTALLSYESRLKACNPLPGQSNGGAAQTANCTGFHVSVSDPAIGTNKTIALEKAQRKQLGGTITTDNRTIASENLVARKECNGVHGTGLSGIVGVGPNCNRDRRQADKFANQSDVSQLETQLSTLDHKIAGQTVAAGQQTQEYATAVTNKIAQLVTTKRADEGRIGLLNRIDALGELASRSTVIAGGTVLLALFIIIVDCLPVLSKMMSGTTRYDKLAEGRLDLAEVIATAGMKVSERQATSRAEIALRTIESEVGTRLEKIDDASRIEKAKRDAGLDRQIADLAAEFRRAAEERDNPPR